MLDTVLHTVHAVYVPWLLCETRQYILSYVAVRCYTVLHTDDHSSSGSGCSSSGERERQQSFALIFTPCNLFVLSSRTVVTDIFPHKRAISFNHAQMYKLAVFFCTTLL
jgi:hypothetical protein